MIHGLGKGPADDEIGEAALQDGGVDRLDTRNGDKTYQSMLSRNTDWGKAFDGGTIAVKCSFTMWLTSQGVASISRLLDDADTEDDYRYGYETDSGQLVCCLAVLNPRRDGTPGA